MAVGNDGSPLRHNYSIFIEQQSTRDAIHVGNLTFQGPNAEHAVSKMLPNFFASVKNELEVLLESGKYNIVVYGGNLDVICNHIQLSKVLNELNWSGSEEFKAQRRQIWTNEDGEIWGYIRASGNLSFVMVRNASHAAAGYKPEQVWKIVTTFAKNGNLTGILGQNTN